jgi:septation ring formation regulator EzrA
LNAAPPSLDAGAAFKSIATEHGILSSLLALAIAGLVGEFWLLMAAPGKREVALAKQAAEHAKEIAAKDAAHTAERNEWQASYSILQESRLSLMREVLAAIHTSTSVMSATQSSIVERTQTASELTAQVTALVAAIRDLRSNTSEDISSLRKLARETSEAVAGLPSKIAGGH